MVGPTSAQLCGNWRLCPGSTVLPLAVPWLPQFTALPTVSWSAPPGDALVRRGGEAGEPFTGVAAFWGDPDLSKAPAQRDPPAALLRQQGSLVLGTA